MALGQVKTDVHEAIARVEASPEFAQFSAANPHHYLVHAFAHDADAPLDLGYYSKEADRIVTFKSDPVTAMPPEEVFKESGTLAPLDLGVVRIGLADALAKAEAQRAKDYSKHAPMRVIAVLQQKEMPFWNITIVTSTMQMINMKLDALTGMLLSREMHSIMSIVRE